MRNYKTRLKTILLIFTFSILLSLLFSFADVRYFYRCLPFEYCWNGASFLRSYVGISTEKLKTVFRFETALSEMVVTYVHIFRLRQAEPLVTANLVKPLLSH